MKINRIIRYLCCLACLVWLGLRPLVALASDDEPKIKLTGKVLGAEGLPVQGATIVIEGTHTGAITEADGSFQLEISKGKALQLSVHAVGFSSKTLVVEPQKQQPEEKWIIHLTSTTTELDAVTVSTSARKSGSVDLVYAKQKAASAISDGISADLIRKSPDKNTGDVLKRVSGTSVQDGKFVIIRGLNERYNTALVNNAQLPSTEPDKRAFAFDIIPASVIDQIVIYKSATPDLPGDFAGGAIEIATKEFPTRKTSDVSLSFGYNSNTTFDAFKNGIPKGKYDFLGYFDDQRKIPLSYEQNKQDFIHQSEAFKTQVTKTFPNTFGYRSASNSLPDFSLSYTQGNTKFYGGAKKLGYVYSIGYGAARQVVNWQIDDYSIDQRKIYGSKAVDYIKKYSLSALANLTYSFNANNRISWKNLYNNKLATSMALRNGANLANETALPFISSANKAQQDGLLQSVFEGTHELTKQSQLVWNGSYALTYRHEPDERILTLNENTEGGYERKLSNENSPEIQNAGRVYSDNKEQLFGANVNYQLRFKGFGQEQILKIGTANYYRLKDVAVNALGYATASAYGAVIPASSTDPFNLFNPENIDKYKITVANIGTNSTDYKGKAWNNAGYVMLENKFSNNWILSWGARISSYRQQLIPAKGTTIEKNNTDILPSGILTYKLGQKTNLRLAASGSVNRPEFRELADYSIYDYNKDFVYRGNPNLVRSKNTNLDFRYEFFPGAGQIMSASVFYKHFKNPIEQVNQGNGVLNYQNAESATLYGGELEIRKKLDFMGSDFLKKITLYGNVTYVDGDIQLNGVTGKSLMQGQSPYLIGAGANYVEGDFSLNLLYNKTGPRLAYRGQGAGQMNIYEKARDVIDAQLSYKFLKAKRLEVKLSVSDLLAQPISWYYKFNQQTGSKQIGYDPQNDRITRQYRDGSTSTLTLKYNF